MSAARKLLMFGSRRIAEATVADVISLSASSAFSRRANLPQQNRGRLSANIRFPLPTSVTVVDFWDAALGITVGTGVRDWLGQKNGNDLQQLTAGLQPGYGASSLFGGYPSVKFTANTHALNCSTVATPLPGTTPRWYWIVAAQSTWSSGTRLCGGSGNASLIYQSGSTPALVQYNGANANSNTNGALGSARVIIALFNNNTTDYLKVGSSRITGASATNINSSALWGIGDRADSGLGSLSEFAAILICNGEPNGAEQASLAAWAASKYGSGVLT